MTARAPRGRFAPSPTGELHLGNASSALLAWLSVRSRQGAMVMRIEDLDPARSREAFTTGHMHDLQWLGLDWDEGPDVGGPYGPYVQSKRTNLYDRAFTTLRETGRVYPCFCSRRDVAAAASAPQVPGDEIVYAGTCRALVAADAARRIAEGERHAWRFRVSEEDVVEFEDARHGRIGRDATPAGDFVVRRSDGVAAYHLAVVVVDDAMHVDDVVRGEDLLRSTPRQILLARALGLSVPAYAHVPLLTGADGARLSKRHAGITLRELRRRGHSASGLVGRLASLLGLRAEASPVEARDLIDGFEWSRVPPRREGILAEPASWTPARNC